MTVLVVCLALVILRVEVHANALHSMRIGQHQAMSRVVFRLQQDTSYQIETAPDPFTIRVVFPVLTIPAKLQHVRTRDPLVQEIRLRTTPAAVIGEIVLKQPGTVQRHTQTRTPHRVILDIIPRGSTAAPVAAESPRQGEAAQKPQSPNPSAAVPLTSLSPAQLLERAEQHWAARQIDAAQRFYTTVLQRYPEYPNNHLIAARLADILREQQHPRAALEAYTAVIQGYPGSEGALISQIRLAELGAAFPDLLPPGDEPRYTAYRQPMATMRRLITEYPFSPFADVARFKIGEILLRQHEFSAALESFETLLGRPLQEPLRQDVANSLHQTVVQLVAEQQQRGAFPEVLRTFFTYKKHLRPADALHSDLLLPVALSYAHLGLLEEAQSLFASLLPTLSQPEQQVSLAFDQALRLAKSGQLRTAATLLTPPERFTEPARRMQALTLLTQDAWQGRRLDDTVRYGKQAVAAVTDPGERTMLWSLLGAAHEARGEAEPAMHALLQCAAAPDLEQNATAGQHAEACLTRAAALQAQFGQQSQVAALYERLLRTFPNSTSKEANFFRLAELHRQQGDTAQMLATFTRLRDNTSDTFWQKVAAEYLDQAQWHERLHERLAAFQNSLMR